MTEGGVSPGGPDRSSSQMNLRRREAANVCDFIVDVVLGGRADANAQEERGWQRIQAGPRDRKGEREDKPGFKKSPTAGMHVGEDQKRNQSRRPCLGELALQGSISGLPSPSIRASTPSCVSQPTWGSASVPNRGARLDDPGVRKPLQRSDETDPRASGPQESTG